MTVYQFLSEVRSVIFHPMDWCKGACCIDKDGNRTWPGDPNGRQYCLWGAIHYVKRQNKIPDNSLMIEEAIGRLLDYTDDLSLSRFNDISTHRDVIELIDDVIFEYK